MKKALVGGICGAVITAATMLICGWQDDQDQEKQQNQRQKFMQQFRAMKEKVDDLEQRVSDLEEAVLLSMGEDEDKPMDEKAPANSDK